ncbi:MAG: hypothetical protein J6T94_11105 [Bacteroidaceae bacterium]|nr:hypothetical protein [Bacteroidaceae bacterium]
MSTKTYVERKTNYEEGKKIFREGKKIFGEGNARDEEGKKFFGQSISDFALHILQKRLRKTDGKSL